MKFRHMFHGEDAILSTDMPIEAWEKLGEQLRSSPLANQWPSWEFLSCVDELVKTGKRNLAAQREWKDRPSPRP